MLSSPPDTTIAHRKPALIKFNAPSMWPSCGGRRPCYGGVAPVASVNPAPRAACRAGAWPCPSVSTQSHEEFAIRPAKPARPRAAPGSTWEPSRCALKEERSPYGPDGSNAGNGKYDRIGRLPVHGFVPRGLPQAGMHFELQSAYERWRYLQRRGWINRSVKLWGPATRIASSSRNRMIPVERTVLRFLYKRHGVLDGPAIRGAVTVGLANRFGGAISPASVVSARRS